MDSHLHHLPYSMEALQYPHFHYPFFHHHHQPTSIPTSVIRSTAAATTAAASVSHSTFDPKLLYDPFFLSLLQAPPNISFSHIKSNPFLQDPFQWSLPPLYSAIVQPSIKKTTPIKPVPIRFSNAPLFQPYLNDSFNKNTHKFKKSLEKPYEKPLNLSNKKPKVEVKAPATSDAENSNTFNPNSPKNCTFPVDSKLKLSQVIDKIFTDAFERCMFEE